MNEKTSRTNQKYISLDGYLYPEEEWKDRQNSQNQLPLGKYGRMLGNYLEQEQPGLYAQMMFDGTLPAYLTRQDQLAREKIETMVHQSLEKHPAPHRNRNPLEWTGYMNNLKSQAEELVLQELMDW